MQLPNRGVAAMDFPFSVPLAFATDLGHSKREMPALWEKAFSMKTLETFRDKAKPYQECLRVGDLEHAIVHPPLRSPPRSPVMINMTFRGMQMMHCLYNAKRFEVPPLTPAEPNSPVLLETMPGLALHAFGLASARYKDGDNETERLERRKTRTKILRILIQASEVELAHENIPAKIREDCVDDQGGDALDSLVAAIVAARWARRPLDFLTPSEQVVKSLKRKTRNKRQASNQAKDKRKIDVAKTEGWIYVPK